MAKHTLKIDLKTEIETSTLAQSLSHTISQGDTILLSGPVGAGKTHFARALIKSLLIDDEDVPSPTFTLVQTYDTRAGELWHADLYRLSNEDEIEELGLSDAMSEGICLIEWPDRLGSYTPQNALHLDLSPARALDHRTIVAHWNHPKWDLKLDGWQNE